MQFYESVKLKGVVYKYKIMEIAYTDYALSLKKCKTDLSRTMFMGSCILRVANLEFNQDPMAMRAAVIAHMFPGKRVVSGSILIKTNLIPFKNIFDAFEAVHAWGLTLAEVALVVEEDGTINFALSLDGLKMCANHCPAIQEMLLHAEWVFSACKLYCA